MTISARGTRGALDRLALDGGGFAMVAIDQRESLRAMLAQRRTDPVRDSDLIDFKLAVASALASTASAMLFDRAYAMPALEHARATNQACGIILAADRLHQSAGRPVLDTSIDADVRPAEALTQGVAALKLLVVWTGERARTERCLRLSEEFMATCRASGLLGIVEGVVKPPAGDGGQDWDRETELHAAAMALGGCDPDIYKCEVPHFGRGDPGQIEEDCARITESLHCPWVVLSSGIERDDFPAAVASACRGGASGFLAGRAIWGAAAASPECDAWLKREAVGRLGELADIVRCTARPWTDGSPR